MKKRISLLLVMAIVLVGCGKSAMDASSGELALTDNQSVKYGKVTKRNGNELTIALATKASSDTQSQRGDKNQAGTYGDEKPSKEDSSSNRSNAEGSDGQSGTNRGRGQGQSMPEGMEAPQGESRGQGLESSTSGKGNAFRNKARYQLTGEEETLSIPVGTKVTTMLGTTTTFSRIAVDDTLQLVMEKNTAGEEVVVGVWIVA